MRGVEDAIDCKLRGKHVSIVVAFDRSKMEKMIRTGGNEAFHNKCFDGITRSLHAIYRREVSFDILNALMQVFVHNTSRNATSLCPLNV